MKNTFLIIFVLFSVLAFSQKTVYIYNGSSYSINITRITTQTIPVSSTSLWTSNFSSTNGLLQSGEFLILENTTNNNRFPFSFVSPQTSNISVINWRRKIGSITSTVSNATAFSVNGSTQMFSSIACTVNGGLSGRFELGVNLPTVVTGSGWVADYTVNADPAFPNLQETIITISDF